MTIVRLGFARVALAAVAAATLGCSVDATVAPRAPAAGVATDIVGSLDRVFTLQLRALPPNPILPLSPIFGYGHLQLRLSSVDNSCVPPNPIAPQPGTAVVAVCGKIFNEGGARYTGGGLYLQSGLGEGPPSLIAAFNGALPASTCRRYDIAGAVTVSDAVAIDMVAHPDQYQVRMGGSVVSEATQIGGRLDGGAWGPVGTRPETDPFFAEKVCTIAVTP